jgi:hypothetical protein
MGSHQPIRQTKKTRAVSHIEELTSYSLISLDSRYSKVFMRLSKKIMQVLSNGVVTFRLGLDLKKEIHEMTNLRK